MNDEHLDETGDLETGPDAGETAPSGDSQAAVAGSEDNAAPAEGGENAAEGAGKGVSDGDTTGSGGGDEGSPVGAGTVAAGDAGDPASAEGADSGVAAGGETDSDAAVAGADMAEVVVPMDRVAASGDDGRPVAKTTEDKPVAWYDKLPGDEGTAAGLLKAASGVPSVLPVDFMREYGFHLGRALFAYRADEDGSVVLARYSNPNPGAVLLDYSVLSKYQWAAAMTILAVGHSDEATCEEPFHDALEFHRGD